MGRWIIAVVLLLAMAGADGAASAMDHGRLANIHTIAVIGPQNPTVVQLEVGNFASAMAVGFAGIGGGVIGGAVVGALSSTRDTGQVSGLQTLRLGDEMNAGVTKALGEAGYTIVGPGTNELPDAVLTLTIYECKYVRRVWGAIGPHIVMQADLTERTTGKRLFSRSYRYDMHTLGFTGDLTPDDKYGFDTADEVLAHPDVVAEGLRAAIPMIAADLASVLKR